MQLQTLKIDEFCATKNEDRVPSIADKETQGGTHENNQSQKGIIIGCSIFGTILIVVLVALTIWMCFKRFRAKKMMKQDINVDYNREGVDYEYSTTGEDYNYDTMDNEVSTKRKAVKMELVDRNSVYGKMEEGWEGAVAVDTNPVYGK